MHRTEILSVIVFHRVTYDNSGNKIYEKMTEFSDWNTIGLIILEKLKIKIRK